MKAHLLREDTSEVLETQHVPADSLLGFFKQRELLDVEELRFERTVKGFELTVGERMPGAHGRADPSLAEVQVAEEEGSGRGGGES